MKIKVLLMFITGIIAIASFSGCNNDSNLSESSSPQSENVKVTKEENKIDESKLLQEITHELKQDIKHEINQEAKKEITESEATDIAQQHIESKLAEGDVSIAPESNQDAKTFDTAYYGDVGIDYNSDLNSYEIACKSVCQGYDSNGETVNNYKFNIIVCVDASTGTASSGTFILSESNITQMPPAGFAPNL